MDWFCALFTHKTTLLSVGGALDTNARHWIGRWFAARRWAAEP